MAVAFASFARQTSGRINRDDAFVGYSERRASAGEAKGAGEARALELELELDIASKRRTISIELRERWAPNLVRAIARAVRDGKTCGDEGGDSRRRCEFYRAEGAPEVGVVDGYGGPGPPYALLQGSLAGVEQGDYLVTTTTPKVARSYACLIGRGADFFIATRAHDEWGVAHACFGVVVDMSLVDEITENDGAYAKRRETWGQTNVTVLVERVPFTARLSSSSLDRRSLAS